MHYNSALAIFYFLKLFKNLSTLLLIELSLPKLKDDMRNSITVFHQSFQILVHDCYQLSDVDLTISDHIFLDLFWQTLQKPQSLKVSSDYSVSHQLF